MGSDLTVAPRFYLFSALSSKIIIVPLWAE